MNKMVRKGLLVLSIFLLLGVFSCQQAGVSQADYDNLKSKLSQAESQLKALQQAGVSQADYDNLKSKLSLTESQLKALQEKAAGATATDSLSAELSKTIEGLRKQNELITGQISALEVLKTKAENSLKDLNTKYAELQKLYDALSKPEVITEEKVEQAIFALINQERVKAGVPELAWGRNLSNITRTHGKYMYENTRYEPSTWPFFQEIYWAAGYSSTDKLANGTLLVWKNFEYRYEHGILSKAFKYGAVGAYKAGDVFYITFMAADVP